MAEKASDQGERAEPESVVDSNTHTARRMINEAPLSHMRHLETEERSGDARQPVLDAIRRRRDLVEGGNGQATWDIGELADMAQERWRTSSTIVRAAMSMAGVTRMNLDDADALVTEFRDREVTH